MELSNEKAARCFGADHTYFVTNGTSTANKIVVQGVCKPGDIVLIDRNCHKSHHYGLVLSGAQPLYMDAFPLVPYSMYGAVPLSEIKERLLEMKAQGKLDKDSTMQAKQLKLAEGERPPTHRQYMPGYTGFVRGSPPRPWHDTARRSGCIARSRAARPRRW